MSESFNQSDPASEKSESFNQSDTALKNLMGHNQWDTVTYSYSYSQSETVLQKLGCTLVLFLPMKKN